MLYENIDKLLADVMKSGDETKLNVVRFIKSAITYFIKEGNELNEAAEIKIIQKLKKQQEEDIVMFEKGGRDDLVETAKKEIEILETFLPALPSDDEVRACAEDVCQHYIAENGGLTVKDTRAIIAGVHSKYPSADGKIISEVVHKNIC